MIANMRNVAANAGAASPIGAVPWEPGEDVVDPVLADAMSTVTEDHVVAVLAPEPLSPFEFAIACEVFGIRRSEVIARMARPRWYDLRVCAQRPGVPVATSMGFSIVAEHGLDAVVDADTVIVPMASKWGVSETHRAGWRMPALPDDEVLQARVDAAERGARIVSFCSGAFTRAEAGLLDGRRATTHWLFLDAFRRRYPTVEVVPDVLYVDAGQVLTSAGSAAGLDLSLHLLRADHGADVADLVARRLVIPPHRDGGQAQYTTVPPPRTGGTPFAELLDWLVASLHEPLTVSDMAARAAMSPRTFARRFAEATGTTPLQWLTTQRLARARQLLETTDLTVDVVAARSGLGSAANLRSRLRDACGVSPSAYRQRFKRDAAA